MIEDFTFDVAEGEALGIVGPNGAGKTTLLNLIAGDLRPDRGSSPSRRGRRHPAPAHARCRLGIGRTAQIPRPFEGLSVFENVLVGSTFGSAGRAARFGGGGRRRGARPRPACATRPTSSPAR